MTDSDTLTAARDLVRLARQEQPETFFVVACEEGLSEIGVEDPSAGRTIRHLVKSWAVIDMRSSGHPLSYVQSWGSSGGVQIPESVLGAVDEATIGSRPRSPPIFPSTRRGQGLVQAITGNIENRRSTAEQAVFYALCSLFYGRLSS